MKAWLHRRGRPTWLFESSPQYGLLIHTTRSGTVYAIIPDAVTCKPFWVGQLVGDAWCTVEGELRATSIVFDGAGEYVFPKHERAAT